MRTPSHAHLPAITALLGTNGLPTEDLAQLDLSLFLVDGADDALDAVGGLERCGEHALIRSVAVTPAERGRGLARRLVSALEALARRRGIGELYLLTETAEGFFNALNYATRERATVPDAFRASRQFSSLCPSSATVMSKRLD
ncbi:MAG: arsenic resistance N-acetyltransferase ArsN2 [Pseudomonadota bacterium]